MSLKTEERLVEFGVWWDHHTKKADDGTDEFKLPEDPRKACQMMAKGIESLAHIYLHIVEDIRVLEGRGPVAKNFSKIITPDNMLGRN